MSIWAIGYLILCVPVFWLRMKAPSEIKGPHCTLWRIHLPEGTAAGIVAHEKAHFYTGFPWVLLVVETYGWLFWYLGGYSLIVSIGLGIVTTLALRQVGELFADVVGAVVVGPRHMMRDILAAERAGISIYRALDRFDRFRLVFKIVLWYPIYRLWLFRQALKASE